MKRLLTATLALSLLGGTAAMAQPRPYDARGYEHTRQDDRRMDQRDHRMDRHDDRRSHRWSRGERLPSNYRTRSHYVDYRRHHLRQPPRGYQWVQVDNNYALVALTTGLIAQIIASSR